MQATEIEIENWKTKTEKQKNGEWKREMKKWKWENESVWGLHEITVYAKKKKSWPIPVAIEYRSSLAVELASNGTYIKSLLVWLRETRIRKELR